MGEIISAYQALTNEAIVSEHTAQVSDERATKFRDGTRSSVSALAMSELFNEDARLWRRLADGWDVQTALTTSEQAWKALCRKPKVRGKGFDPSEWSRRMNSYTAWRISSILSNGHSRGPAEVVYISLVDEEGDPIDDGLLLGPIITLTSDILDLVTVVRRRYLIDHPEMAPGMGVELVEVVSTVEGRLNGHPIWGEMFEEAVNGTVK